jgi:uncharacterized membrane protein
MNSRSLAAVCLVLAVLLLFPAFCYVRGQTPVNRYQVNVEADGSAEWVITQVTAISGTVDSWDGFQQKTLSLVGLAANHTGREMAVDADTFEMTTTNYQDSQSKETVFSFTWDNCSILQQSNRVVFGDVFTVAGFFDHLYGEGSLQITFAAGLSVQSVSPSPNSRDDQAHSMDWLGTQFFASSSPSLTFIEGQGSPFTSSTPVPSAAESVWLYALAGVFVSAAVAVSVLWFLVVRRRKRGNALDEKASPIELPLIESEEQKIVKLLQSSGGTAYQSSITEQTRFSKAKASQLLSELERKGVVTRYKKGRDKIVTLAEKGKSERS